MQRFFASRTSASVSAIASSSLFNSQRLKVDEFSGSHDDFKKTIASGTSVVDFFTTWCGPCKAAAPVFNELSEKHTDVKFMKIDVEENEDIGAMMNVRSIPYFVLFQDGKVVGSVEGANMNKLTELIEEKAGKK